MMLLSHFSSVCLLSFQIIGVGTRDLIVKLSKTKALYQMKMFHWNLRDPHAFCFIFHFNWNRSKNISKSTTKTVLPCFFFLYTLFWKYFYVICIKQRDATLVNETYYFKSFIAVNMRVCFEELIWQFVCNRICKLHCHLEC